MNPATPLASPGTGKASILVVDDSRAMREGLACILRQVGYRVDTAADGKEGLARARELSPDLILSDLEMPVATGFDLLSSVRSDEGLAMVPFVMTTGVSDRGSTRRAMELGADDYLTKPFSPDEVLAVVQSRLAKQRNWRQATQALAQRYSQGMMGVLPHEFRTPLNAILGFAELMAMHARKGLSPDQTREFAEVIQNAGKTLLSHTTRFLTLMEYQGCPDGSACEAGAETVCDPAWIRSVVDNSLAVQLPGSQVTATVEAAHARLLCRSDVLQNILAELVGNAVKFARPDSVVTVRAIGDGKAYSLSVENVGPAFPVERLQEVGAFIQFDREHMEQQGLGIGLALVAQALRLCDGRLQIRNLPGSIVSVVATLGCHPEQV